MVYTHHSFVKCDECGIRHYPGNKDDCIEALKEDKLDILQSLSILAGDLIEVSRMPNIEYVADAHNRALLAIREMVRANK